jgi:ubiquinone biosynthesis protein
MNRKPPLSEPGVMTKLPRRSFIVTEPTEVTPPMMPTTSYPVNYWRVVGRMFLWLFVGFRVLWGNLGDFLRRRDSEQRRAVRLRAAFERFPGTFRKIGRLLAMRIDILPWTYCVELSNIVDQMDPFPLAAAIELIEVAVGQPLPDVFAKLDPEPILSSSVAAVYQGILRDGQQVAVKVRRPGIGRLFMADLKALDWLLEILEFLSLLRPGFTRNLRRELRESLEDELNFLLEARYQALFRREAKKSGQKFFDAPKVLFEYCSPDVIVQGFTAGMWLWELLAAIEQQDPVAMARAKALKIDPKKVARRLMWVNFWGLDEHLLFRADLYPDNVIVRQNSRLTFVDFSSVGALSQEKRQAMQQTMQRAFKRDPLEMAQASMILLEPLPPIDTTKFTKDLETQYWQFLYALESKHVEWWERTSARLWLGFVKVARDHNVTMNIQVLRLIRSCLLHDTTAARIYPRIDHTQEYQRFSRFRASAARQRMEDRLREQLTQGLDTRLYLQMETVADTGDRLFRQLQRYLSSPVMKFNAVLGKSVYSLAIFVRLLSHIVIATGLAMGIQFLVERVGGRPWTGFNLGLQLTITNPAFQIILLFLILLNFRTMLFRLGDKEVS